MAFWGLEVKPGKAPTPLSIERRLVIKQAALVVKAAKKSEPCVLSVSVGDDQQRFVVCRLHENNVEQCPMELPFCPEDAAKLHLTGAHSVHLTGFLDLDEDDDLRELEEMEEMDAQAAAAEAAVKPAKGKGKAAPVAADDDDDDDDEDDDDFDEDDLDDLDDDDDDDELDGEDDDDDDALDDDDDDDELDELSDDDGEEDFDDDDDDDDDDLDDDELDGEVVLPPKGGKRPAAAAPQPAAKKAKAAPAPKAKAAAAAPKGSPKLTPAKGGPAGAGTPSAPNTWSKDEDAKLAKALKKHPDGASGRWNLVSKDVGTRTGDQCKKRSKAMAKEG